MANSQPVVPPVVVEEFTCVGSGLLYESYPRESPADLRSLLLPTGGKNGISDRDRSQKWWLAQNKFYGLAQAKATPIGTLRSKLEDALRIPGGMRVPEKILNLESEGNRRYNELLLHVLKETQSPQKGAGKPSTATGMPSKKTSNPTPPKAAASASKGKGATNKPSGKPATTKGGGTSSNSGPAGRLATAKATKATPRTMPNMGLGSFELVEEIVVRTKFTQGKATGASAPRKRGRSPDRMDEASSKKRARPDDEATDFGFICGTYDISAPEILREWEYVGDNLQLVIGLDSEKRLFGSFQFGILSGVLRSPVDIEPRADGANAKFEWCGREELRGSEVYPHKPRMKGVLRFTRRKRDGRHTIKGSMEAVPTLGKCDFTGERVGELMVISERWEDYSEDAYEEF